MKRLVQLLLALLAAFAMAAGGLAQGVDGSTMMRACGAASKQADGGTMAPDEGLLAIYCISYVAGFLDAMSLTSGTTGARKNVCLPQRGITNDQAIRIYLKYLRDNPQILHESGRMSLYVSLAKAFPCN